MPHLSVVVPVYKAERVLHELYNRLRSSLETISNDFEIILVEDSGGDCSWEIIVELSKKDPRVKGLQFSRNFGQHFGITAGLDYAQGDWVVVMDCDLQDRPEEIPNLYAKAQEGYEVVVARRLNRKDSATKRMVSYAFYRVLSYLSDIDHDSQVGNFRIVSKRVVRQFRLMREQLRFFGGLINWLGFPTAAIEVQHAERAEGKSTYTFGKLWRLASDAIIAYSDKPLRISVKFGFLISAISFLYGIYIIYRFFVYGSTVLGWGSMIVSLYFIGGIIIAILGIIGIYLGKTFDQTKGRPLYVVLHNTENLPAPPIHVV